MIEDSVNGAKKRPSLEITATEHNVMPLFQLRDDFFDSGYFWRFCKSLALIQKTRSRQF